MQSKCVRRKGTARICVCIAIASPDPAGALLLSVVFFDTPEGPNPQMRSDVGPDPF